jgi:hypothetical protein
MTDVDGPSSFAELQEKNLTTPQPSLECDVAHVIGSVRKSLQGGGALDRYRLSSGGEDRLAALH